MNKRNIYYLIGFVFFIGLSFILIYEGVKEVSFLAPGDSEVIFVPPTPEEGSVFDSDSVYINMTNTLDADSYSFVDSGDDVLGWWRFEETTADNGIEDLSGNGNDGILKAQSYLSSGKFGNAINFEGINSHMRLGDSAIFDKTHNFAVSLWVKPASVQSAYKSGIFARGNRFDTEEQNQYVIYFEEGDVLLC